MNDFFAMQSSVFWKESRCKHVEIFQNDVTVHANMEWVFYFYLSQVEIEKPLCIKEENNDNETNYYIFLLFECDIIGE